MASGSSGPFGGAGAASFAGTSSIIDTANTPVTSTANWTLEAWVNPSSTSQTGMVAYNGDEASWAAPPTATASASRLRRHQPWRLPDRSLRRRRVDPTGWCNFQSRLLVRHRRNGQLERTVTFYINGTQVYQGTPGVSPNTPVGGMMIGGYNPQLPSYGGTTTRYFQGEISNVAFYPTALSSTSVRRHFNAEAARRPIPRPCIANSPTAYYELDEGAQINEYVIPNSGYNPQGITTGPDGNVWFVDAVRSGSSQLNQVVVASPVTTVNSGNTQCGEHVQHADQQRRAAEHRCGR